MQQPVVQQPLQAHQLLEEKCVLEIQRPMAVGWPLEVCKAADGDAAADGVAADNVDRYTCPKPTQKLADYFSKIGSLQFKVP